MSDSAAPVKFPNRSLQEKTSARLAAAQLLYQAAMSGDRPDAARMRENYRAYVEENRENPKEAHLPLVPASQGYLLKLLEGVTAHAEALEPWVDKAITSEWTKSRMSPLLLAILRLAVFELAHFPQLKTSVIVSEYVALTARFFGEAEVGFVNAALSAVAEEMRK